MIYILQVIGKLKVGGAENILMNWFRHIDSTQFHFDFVVFGEEIGEYEKEVEDKGSLVFHTTAPGRDSIHFKKQMTQILKGHHYDIIHGHTLLSSGVVLECAKENGILGRVAHAHSTQNRVNENIVTLLYQKIMRNKLNKNATDYLACGEAAGRFLYGNEMFEKKGKLIHNAIEPNRFSYNQEKRVEIRKQFGVDENVVLLGMVSRFHPVKNHKFAIELLHELDVKYKLILVGDGELHSEIVKQIKELDLENRVLFAGMQSDPSCFYSAIDVLLMPSFHEGLPVSLIEAQAAGVKILASDTITKEVNLSNTIQYLSIQEKASWEKAILKTTSYERKNWINGSDYDILKEIKKLEEVYTKYGKKE